MGTHAIDDIDDYAAKRLSHDERELHDDGAPRSS